MLERHRQRASRWTTPARRRRGSHQAHPIEDFLFTYYPFSMRKLTQWHPGFGTGLELDSSTPEWLHKSPYSLSEGSITLPVTELGGTAAGRLRWIRDLLVATRDRAPNFGCHGVHEWAMVYGGTDVRHRESCPLRLPQEEIDAFVRSRSICCSHFDAFRFFQPETRPMNRLQPDMDSRVDLEQPGCLHAGMDLYKWASKSMPWVGSDLQLDCFELAVELRELDMRASPYDLTEYGYQAVPVETADGRRLYEQLQRELAGRAAPLRQQLIDQLSTVLAAHAHLNPAHSTEGSADHMTGS